VRQAGRQAGPAVQKPRHAGGMRRRQDPGKMVIPAARQVVPTARQQVVSGIPVQVVQQRRR